MRILVLVMAGVLSGCWVVELRGPWTYTDAATFHLSRAKNEPVLLIEDHATTSSTQAIHRFGQDWWDSQPDWVRLVALGNFTPDPTFYEDDVFYWLSVEDGFDVDADGNLVIDAEAEFVEVPRLGIYVQGKHLKGFYRSNALALAVSAVFRADAEKDDRFADDAALRAWLDYAARILVEDINGDGVTEYEDLLLWSYYWHQDFFTGSKVFLEAFIEAVQDDNRGAFDVLNRADDLLFDAKTRHPEVAAPM